MRQKAAIEHHIPGRLRMHVAHGKKNAKVLDGIAKSVRSLTGVRDVQVSPTTGSILVHYNKTQYAGFEKSLADQGESSELFSLAECVEQEAEILAVHSDLIRGALDGIRSLNQDLKALTGNQLDLKVLTGLVATAFAFMRRAEGTPLWVTLAIFTLHSHVELQRHSPLAGLQKRPNGHE